MEKRRSRPRYNPASKQDSASHIPIFRIGDGDPMPPFENDQKCNSDDVGDPNFPEAEPDSPSRVPFYWEGEQESAPISWLVRDLIPDRSVSLVIGESQAGKSFVAIDLAISVASEI